MQKRVENAIDIFLDAISNNTLAKGTCAACAVGNLCAKVIGHTPTLNTDWQPNNIWARLFMTSRKSQQDMRVFNTPEDIKEAEELISKTEFTEEELAKIEYAFETNTQIDYVLYGNYTPEELREDQIKGLEAVVKVMLSFDGSKEKVKEVFTKRADLIPV